MTQLNLLFPRITLSTVLQLDQGRVKVEAGKPVGRLLHNLCDKMMKMGTGVEWNEEWEEIGAGRHLGFKFSEGLDFCGDR